MWYWCTHVLCWALGSHSVGHYLKQMITVCIMSTFNHDCTHWQLYKSQITHFSQSLGKQTFHFSWLYFTIPNPRVYASERNSWCCGLLSRSLFSPNTDRAAFYCFIVHHVPDCYSSCWIILAMCACPPYVSFCCHAWTCSDYTLDRCVQFVVMWLLILLPSLLRRDCVPWENGGGAWSKGRG